MRDLPLCAAFYSPQSIVLPKTRHNLYACAPYSLRSLPISNAFATQTQHIRYSVVLIRSHSFRIRYNLDRYRNANALHSLLIRYCTLIKRFLFAIRPLSNATRCMFELEKCVSFAHEIIDLWERMTAFKVYFYICYMLLYAHSVRSRMTAFKVYIYIFLFVIRSLCTLAV